MAELSYYEKNKEECKQRAKEYYKQNKQRVKEYYKQYYELNKCKILEMRQNNPLRKEWFKQYYISTKGGRERRFTIYSQKPKPNNFEQGDKVIVVFT